jgi:plastocyanin
VLTRGALALSLLAGGPASVEPPADDEVIIVATEDADTPFAFEPAELTVEVGATVRWRNITTDVFHTVTFTDSLERRRDNGVFNESLFAAGDIVAYTFDEPGTYAYFCQPHSAFMAGTIVVAADDEPAADEQSSVWPWWIALAAGSVALVAAAVLTWGSRSRHTVTDR